MKHKSKIVAPVIITVLCLLYFIGYGVFITVMEMPWWIKLLGIVIPLILAGVSISVLVERIKEIRSGEEDDLSKY